MMDAIALQHDGCRAKAEGPWLQIYKQVLLSDAVLKMGGCP
jgi:hypothetical protein